MSKKFQSALTVVLLLVCCLCLFTSCATQKIDFFSNIEDTLGVVGKLVRAMHSWIGNYGWTVVVFTVFLKVLMLPLDFWQRFAMRKASLKTQKIQPLLTAIDKRYGANSQKAQEEKSKLLRKNGGTGMGGTCLPMIVSMVVFFVMFGGLREYSNYSSVAMFKELSHEYFDTCIAEFDKDADFAQDMIDYRAALDAALANKQDDSEGNTSLKVKINSITGIVSKYASDSAMNAKTADITTKAREAVKKKYVDSKESWLWIQNVWQPDTWETIMAPYDGSGTNTFGTIVDKDTFPGGRNLYDTIRNAVLETGGYGKNGSWNGLLILPVLSIALSFLSMFISQKTESKRRAGQDAAAVSTEQAQQQQMTNKTMMIIMPLMMAYFGFLYTGAFAIYMVCNYALSILSTLALSVPVEKAVAKSMQKQEEKDNSGKASYMR